MLVWLLLLIHTGSEYIVSGLINEKKKNKKKNHSGINQSVR